jgi:hypothetical protein
MRRGLLLGPLLALLFAPAALASRVTGTLEYCMEGDVCRYFPEPRLRVSFVAEPRERNSPAVRIAGETVTVDDPGSTIAAGGQCRSASPHEAVCKATVPIDGVQPVLVSTGDLADSVTAADAAVYRLGSGDDVARGGRAADTFSGGSGDDRLDGGAGRDLLTGGRGRDVIGGGSGNDRIRAHDHRRDRVRCGRGFDRVSADRFDLLSGCERVHYPRRRR